MVLSKQLLAEIVRLMEKLGDRPIDFAERIGVTQATISRILSGKVRTISDTTVEKIAKGTGAKHYDLQVLSMGGWPEPSPIKDFRVFEDQDNYSSDVFTDLMRWLRDNKTPAKAKSAVLITAELGGFASKRLKGALDVLSSASLPACHESGKTA